MRDLDRHAVQLLELLHRHGEDRRVRLEVHLLALLDRREPAQRDVLLGAEAEADDVEDHRASGHVDATLPGCAFTGSSGSWGYLGTIKYVRYSTRGEREGLKLVKKYQDLVVSISKHLQTELDAMTTGTRKKVGKIRYSDDVSVDIAVELSASTEGGPRPTSGCGHSRRAPQTPAYSRRWR